MKTIFIILGLLTIVCVFGFDSNPGCKKTEPIRITVLMQKSDSIKMLKDSILMLNAEREYFYDQMKFKSDSILILKQELNLLQNQSIMSQDCFSAKFKLAKIKRYTDICLRNSSQKKFYFGWISRTIAE
jgi:hypothetical protein